MTWWKWLLESLALYIAGGVVTLKLLERFNPSALRERVNDVVTPECGYDYEAIAVAFMFWWVISFFGLVVLCMRAPRSFGRLLSHLL